MTDVQNIVLVPGWGFNATVWFDFAQRIARLRPELGLHLIDLPGYGNALDVSSPDDLPSLAACCLEQAPERAIWVGWSLGGMVAMQAAISSGLAGIQGLQLMATSAKFISSTDYDLGVDLNVFEQFCDQLSDDYQRAIRRFLLLQAGTRQEASSLVEALYPRVAHAASPSRATLEAGLACLANSDLRSVVAQINVPTQVIVGALDRVANPRGGEQLAQAVDAELVILPSGHAPFITHADQVAAALDRLISIVNGVSDCD